MSKSKIIIITVIGIVINLIISFFNVVMVDFIPTAFVMEDVKDHLEQPDVSNSASEEISEESEMAGDILSEAIVICPQTPAGWNISDWEDESSSYNENGYLAIAKRIVDYNVKKYNGDTDRIYLTGLSLGSFATWTLLGNYPNYFAVSVPVCGGGGDYFSSSVINTPIWLYHGTSDPTVPFSSSEKSYNALIKAGAKEVKFTRLQGVKHNAWNYAYVDREMFTWMFCHTKNGTLERDYTLGNTFEVLSSGGQVIITQSDIIDAEMVFDNGYDYIELLLSSESADRLRKEYKSNKNKQFSVKCIGKNLYDYKVLEIPEDNIFRIERTIDDNDYKSIYNPILNSFYD